MSISMLRWIGHPVTLMLTIALASCAMQPVRSPESVHITEVGAADLIGTEWQAIWVSGQLPVPGSEPTISFGAQRVEGSDGCNSYSGPATLITGEYRPGEISTTRVACADPLAQKVATLFAEIIDRPQPIGLDEQRRLVIGPE
ncbi:MAG: META domain-containing protein [Candidatus Limnocylindria bacterium]